MSLPLATELVNAEQLISQHYQPSETEYGPFAFYPEPNISGASDEVYFRRFNFVGRPQIATIAQFGYAAGDIKTMGLCRFRNVNIPHGAIITEAYWRIYTQPYVSGPDMMVLLKAISLKSPDLPSSLGSDRAWALFENLTEKFTEWMWPTGWPTTYGFQNSPSLIPVIQEIVIKDYWKSRQDLMIIGIPWWRENPGAACGATWYTYREDMWPSYKCSLNIKYRLPVPY